MSLELIYLGLYSSVRVGFVFKCPSRVCVQVSESGIYFALKCVMPIIVFCYVRNKVLVHDEDRGQI